LPGNNREQRKTAWVRTKPLDFSSLKTKKLPEISLPKLGSFFKIQQEKKLLQLM
jgi:hypothetical protein